MSEEPIVAYEDGLQIITFNRLKTHNSLNSNVLMKLIEALGEGSARPDVKMTVVTGKGPYFSSGYHFDASSNSETSVEGNLRINLAVFSKFINVLIDYPKLLVAIINGHAVGMSVTILGLFDIIYAVESATFHTPFTSLGLSAEGCSSYSFPRILGKSLAAKMLYFGYKMSALEAKNCGFIAGIYQLESTSTLLNELKEYTKLPVNSIIATKRMICSENRQALKAVNASEVELLTERFLSEDFFNAMATKLERKSKSKL